MAFPSSEAIARIYGTDAAEATARYQHLEEEFVKLFGTEPTSYFTAPGRTEIIGNHTDHNGGKILAASVTMDTISAAEATDDGIITIVSEGYPDPIVVDTNKLEEVPLCKGSVSLVGGIMAAAKEKGFNVGGFRCYTTTKVISSAGISSSASFEMLVCTMMNHFYNNDTIGYADFARMGQYAENVFWKKASGLMDQMACAAGGTILLDFSEGVKSEKVDFSLDDLGYAEIIINTGKGHADLSAEYSSIPGEMRQVAAELGCTNLCESSMEALLPKIPAIRAKLGNDRAILRAIHYYEECARVDKAAAAIAACHPEELIGIIDASGRSSFTFLQNCYCIEDAKEQSIPYALALTAHFLEKIGKGSCRVHGGGFAGVIMCAIPQEYAEEYMDYMANFFDRSAIHKMNIRKIGAVCVE